jgi:hypothetical protein
VDTAHDWGFSPTQFRALSDEDRAEMMAYLITTRKMQAFEHQLAEKEARKAQTRNARHGSKKKRGA